jgi:signal peptidase I
MTTASSTAADRIRERQLKRQQGKAPSGNNSATAHPVDQQSFPRKARGWADALVFAFTLAMFIRVFLFELFMIPTGSMTPTLIGDDIGWVNEYDYDKDGLKDIIVAPPGNNNFAQVHLKTEGGMYDRIVVMNNLPRQLQQFYTQAPRPKSFFAGLGESLGFGIDPEDPTLSKGRRDMIMVNKFAFWFSEPTRGDITVFKVPDRPKLGHAFDVRKPVYIKRVAAGPSEELVVQNVETPIRSLLIGDAGRISPPEYDQMATGSRYLLSETEIRSKPLLVNGKPVEDELYNHLHHFPHRSIMRGFPSGMDEDQVFPITQKDPGFVMLGDNQLSSSDSRVWGRVPVQNIRGKAILRYWPLRSFTLLYHGK